MSLLKCCINYKAATAPHMFAEGSNGVSQAAKIGTYSHTESGLSAFADLSYNRLVRVYLSIHCPTFP